MAIGTPGQLGPQPLDRLLEQQQPTIGVDQPPHRVLVSGVQRQRVPERFRGLLLLKIVVALADRYPGVCVGCVLIHRLEQSRTVGFGIPVVH